MSAWRILEAQSDGSYSAGRGDEQEKPYPTAGNQEFFKVAVRHPHGNLAPRLQIRHMLVADSQKS